MDLPVLSISGRFQDDSGSQPGLHPCLPEEVAHCIRDCIVYAEGMTTNGTMTPEIRDRYADEIWVSINEDMLEGRVNKRAASFSELHEYVDANEYMIQADVPWNPDSEQTQDAYVAVQDEITDRLARHANLTAGTRVRFYLGDTPETHPGVITEPYYTDGEYAGHVMVKDADGTEQVLHVSDIRVDTDDADEVGAPAEPARFAVVTGRKDGEFYSFTRMDVSVRGEDWQVAGDVGWCNFARVLEYTAQDRQIHGARS